MFYKSIDGREREKKTCSKSKSSTSQDSSNTISSVQHKTDLRKRKKGKKEKRRKEKRKKEKFANAFILAHKFKCKWKAYHTTKYTNTKWKKGTICNDIRSKQKGQVLLKDSRGGAKNKSKINIRIYMMTIFSSWVCQRSRVDSIRFTREESH